eukprot:2874991-Pyramimonas_sp.AAC.1
MSVYLYDCQGLGAGNMAIISGVLRCAGLLNLMGVDWIALGDWNVQPDAWADESLEQVRGFLLDPETATSRE